MKIYKVVFGFMAVIFMLSANVEAKISDSVNSFSWKYFSTLDKDKNIFYSPYSIAAALSIVANGATGKTQQEILSALSVDSVDSLNSDFKNFRDTMKTNYTDERLLKESNLMLVNKKFASRGIDAEFKNTLQNFYQSEVHTADFVNNLEGEKKKIKDWVAKSTDNFIPNYSASPTAQTVVNLFNVIYFKSSWKYTFDKRDTQERTFINKDGSKSEVNMMWRDFKNSIPYYEDEKYKAISLPYQSLDNKIIVSMYLILPKDENNLNIVENWNTESVEYKENFFKNVKGRFEGEVYVRLPKLDLDLKNEIVKNLKSVGISRAFTNNSEIFNIVKDTPLKIDNVFHQAKLQIDEQGTEAAALTEIVMLEATAMPFERQKRTAYFYAERPFLFVIRDVESETDLFVGAINELQ